MMARAAMKMKRKEVDDFSDDFSDFSLSSPARKIRRLDADLPPIIEEEEAEVQPVMFDEPPQQQQQQQSSVVIEELPPSCDENQERALVLYKPVNYRVLRSPSPSNFSFSMDSQFLSGFKNHFLWSTESDHEKSAEEEATAISNVSSEGKEVVPWVPYQFPLAQGTQPEAVELMEADEMGEVTMDIEDDISGVIASEQGKISGFGGMSGVNGLPQWPQQHCLIPQLPQNTTTPVTWLQ